MFCFCAIKSAVQFHYFHAVCFHTQMKITLCYCLSSLFPGLIWTTLVLVLDTVYPSNLLPFHSIRSFFSCTSFCVSDDVIIIFLPWPISIGDMLHNRGLSRVSAITDINEVDVSLCYLDRPCIGKLCYDKRVRMR